MRALKGILKCRAPIARRGEMAACTVSSLARRGEGSTSGQLSEFQLGYWLLSSRQALARARMTGWTYRERARANLCLPACSGLGSTRWQ